MVLAKEAGHEAARPRPSDRRQAAQPTPDVAKVEVAGPGFINLALEPAVWHAALAPRIRGRARTTGAAPIGAARRSMSNTSRPIRPGRCMSATAAARCSAMRWPICSTSPATRSRANTTSTMPARRSTCSPARRSCATARRSARTSARSRTGSIPATISSPSAQALAARARHALLNQMPEERLAAAGAREGRSP